jgi:hypothetical protein
MEFGLVPSSYGKEFVEVASPAYDLPAYILAEPAIPATRTYLVVINPALVGPMVIELFRLLCTVLTANYLLARQVTQLLELRVGVFKGDSSAIKEPPTLDSWFATLHMAIPHLALFLNELCMEEYISRVACGLPSEYMDQFWDRPPPGQGRAIDTLRSRFPKEEQRLHLTIANMYGSLNGYVEKAFADTPSVANALKSSAAQRMDSALRGLLLGKSKGEEA